MGSQSKSPKVLACLEKILKIPAASERVEVFHVRAGWEHGQFLCPRTCAVVGRRFSPGLVGQLPRAGAPQEAASAPSLRSNTDAFSWEMRRRSDPRFQTLNGNVSHPPQPALQPNWEPAAEDSVPAAVRARWPAVFSPQFLCLSTTCDFVSCLSVFAI